MSQLVQVQTLRGNAGLEEAQKVVKAAVEKHNAIEGNEQHVCDFFQALPPNVKGMQVQLSLLAVLARNHGATLIRLSVHNGNVALCGLQESVDDVKDKWTATYNAMVTKAAATYRASEHGPRMGFMNGFLCGLCAGQDVVPAELAYGLGTLFSFPKPGNGSAYDLGASSMIDMAEAPVEVETPKPTKTRIRKSA